MRETFRVKGLGFRVRDRDAHGGLGVYLGLRAQTQVR